MDVILVHGLWYGPWAMGFLARYLQRLGFAVRQFAYRPRASSATVHAQQLARFAAANKSRTTHFVGHSLGGLVILHMLAARPEFVSGRVVLLGTPLQGSRVARRVVQLPGGATLLGQVAADLCNRLLRWPEGAGVGMIAGCRALGAGRLIVRPDPVSDGTVDAEEADSEHLTGRVVLPVSHMGMLFSRQVAQQLSGFLQTGRFPAVDATRQNDHS